MWWIEILLEVDEEDSQERILGYFSVLGLYVVSSTWPKKKGIARISGRVENLREARRFIRETSGLDGMLSEVAIPDKFEEKISLRVHVGLEIYSREYLPYIKGFLKKRLNLKPEYRQEGKLTEIFVDTGKEGYQPVREYTRCLGKLSIKTEKIW